MGKCSNELLEQILLRIIYHRNSYFPSAHLFNKSSCFAYIIQQLYQLRICILAFTQFKSQNNLSTHYNARHFLFSLPHPSSSSTGGHRWVAYRVSSAWNSLPIWLRVIDSQDGFRAASKQYLLDSLG